MNSKRSAIALMITLFFIIAISVSLGISLNQTQSVRTEISKQKFTMQSSMIVNDVVGMLNGISTKISDSKTLYDFLQEYSDLPLEINGIMVHLSIESARSKININILKKDNADVKILKEYLRKYFSLHGINSEYPDMLMDNMNGIKVDDSYNSDIFTYRPYLFRDYIVSLKHLKEINNFYTKMYNDNALSKINFEELFYFSKDSKTKLDVNYISANTWRFLLGCSETRAEELTAGAGSYEKKDDLDLTPLELEVFNDLKIDSYFEKFLDIKISLDNGALSSRIRFEYDIAKKKGYNFVYEI
jgi:hypothetical protein